jgi:hypothetical protein
MELEGDVANPALAPPLPATPTTTAMATTTTTTVATTTATTARETTQRAMAPTTVTNPRSS